MGTNLVDQAVVPVFKGGGQVDEEDYRGCGAVGLAEFPLGKDGAVCGGDGLVGGLLVEQGHSGSSLVHFNDDFAGATLACCE
ncbi:MAG: hypothetical protein Q4A03_00090 [Rothia sp. (in: high G+C Gram-positive bacteria)]|uniref:hypothetical protein n=1 Tax=Rothia sp. (in: high G+C Gram-positive bacteria) TaxID=1885016 RepID=UPI0027077A04|nr:hypothetical protein [Rothia sp. (in: high G+C Gram-positive bacteria)]